MKSFIPQFSSITVPPSKVAVKLPDEEGLEALSMRRVAERLSKSVMSLYTYVPGKAELVDLMLDTVYAELPTEYPLDGGWRAAMEASARAGCDFYQRHPWVLQISGVRSILGPHESDVYETQLRLVDGLGLSPVDMTRVVTVVSSFVRGAAKTLADSRVAERATGMSDDEWWNARAPLMGEFMDQQKDRYPTISRIASQEGFDQAGWPEDDTRTCTKRIALDTFEFGLQRLLDGSSRLSTAARPFRADVLGNLHRPAASYKSQPDCLPPASCSASMMAACAIAL
jgi:AcrR family transcriptional regulator